MLKRLMISVLLFLLTWNINAQQLVTPEQASVDILQVNRAYINAKTLQMNVNYLLYPNFTTDVPFENEKGVFMKQGNNTYSELLGIISLRNNKVSLTIDKNEQTMIVADPPLKDQLNPGMVNLDSLLTVCSSIEYQELNEQTKFYKLKFDSSPFSQYSAIDIYINSKTNLLNKLILYFRDEIDLNENDNVDVKEVPRLEIDYTSVDTSPVFATTQFSELQYITGSGKKISCAASYSGYHLINHKLQ